MTENEEKNDHSSLPESNSIWSIRPYPELIDTSKIENDGGRWIRLEDGRVVEYFVSGCVDDANAKVLVDCPGGNCTGRMFSAFSSWVETARSLGYRVISVSVPGFGYSSIQPGRRIGDWPVTDLLPILKREGVSEFVVTGISFGTCHALATAWKFGNSDFEGISCTGMGLRVPYLGSESCRTLGLENHLTVGYTSVSANTSCLGTLTARLVTSFASRPSDAFKTPGPLMRLFMNYLNPGALEKLQALQSEHPEWMDTCRVEMDRSVVHGDQGILYNYATDTLIDHGFEATEIRKDIPVVVWYADDDEDCPPSHGRWIANEPRDGTSDNHHFTNVSSRGFDNYGHFGTAFLNHDEFLKSLHDHVTNATSKT